MKKDLRLAIEAAAKAAVKLELAQKTKEVYDEVENMEPAKDFSVVYKWLREKS